MNQIFFHTQPQELLPVGIKFDTISNIDYYNDQTIDRILIQDLLDYVPVESANQVLKIIKNKLAPNGRLEIQATDIRQLCMAVTYGDIDLVLAKNILYGHKKNIYSIYDMESMVKNLGLEIETKQFINIFEYHIVCVNKQPQ